MWSYLIRRLLVMIPTLFGITVVSFAIMHLSPGDPLLNQGKKSANPSQSRESYLIRKRELKLDKPLFLNFNYFYDFAGPALAVSHYLGIAPGEVEEELPALANNAPDPTLLARRRFLKSLDVYQFDRRLADPAQHPALAQSILDKVQIFCEDRADYAVPAMMSVLQDDKADLPTKRGAVRGLNHMLVDPFVYTYAREPDETQTPEVLASWETWWRRSKKEFEPVSPQRKEELPKALHDLTHAESRMQMMELLEKLHKSDAPFFAEKLVGDASLEEKNASALMLRLYLAKPLHTDVAVDADQQQVDEVAENWLAYYHARQNDYEPNTLERVGNIFSDTQYARMVWRLLTFNFGRSTLKSGEPVASRIWNAAKVTAPLMLLAEGSIYMIAVPLGMICAIYRGKRLDRVISFVLLVLYSVPAFVAAMLCLLLFCYGDYLKLFPMSRLHSPDAAYFGWGHYLLDYAWHAFMPVTCLTLFSLAWMAIYARSSMLDVIGQDYVRTARAKGVSETKVILKHVLRNGLIPIITLFADFLPAMLGGSVLVEYLFNIPGMGRLSWDTIKEKDYPTLMAMIYIDAIFVMLSILVADLLYLVVDPRISFDSREETG